MGSYKPKLHYFSVIWKPPDIIRIKCNTDGASRGNSSLSSFGYCLRDSRGDILFAKSRGIATNMEPECLAILDALISCKERKLQDVLIETDSLSLKKNHSEGVESILGIGGENRGNQRHHASNRYHNHTHTEKAMVWQIV
ncbi:uncharacterized protein LOC125856869 [Solanum stenotomum]|uniref:uncharacterized protein LOC125856869 n=1 Tax=Solanum stenotomum TaxID=172797 RepID=UPI0020D12BCF|nr:uncharacterized protein LOC125856869 [Solanum stenotomum]